jgi:hypothetical protein
MGFNVWHQRGALCCCNRTAAVRALPATCWQDSSWESSAPNMLTGTVSTYPHETCSCSSLLRKASHINLGIKRKRVIRFTFRPFQPVNDRCAPRPVARDDERTTTVPVGIEARSSSLHSHQMSYPGSFKSLTHSPEAAITWSSQSLYAGSKTRACPLLHVWSTRSHHTERRARRATSPARECGWLSKTRL